MDTPERLDLLLVARGLAESRARAQALIEAGRVSSNGVILNKPSRKLAPDTPLTVTQEHPWVSRGGMKLARALEFFSLDPAGQVALDIGASTGGFTEVLLTHDAAKVYAVDVGHGQLAAKLQNDPRVLSLEHTNARYLTRAEIPDPIGIVTCDASFISLKLVLPAALALTAPEAWLVALIKPQFEVGKGRVGKGGVVRDEALHREVCDDISAWLAAQDGWDVLGITDSPITGPEGNKEFLIAGRINKS